jgi:hypothetical protein
VPAGAVSWLKLDIMCFSFSVPVLLGLPWGTASPAHPRRIEAEASYVAGFPVPLQSIFLVSYGR